MTQLLLRRPSSVRIPLLLVKVFALLCALTKTATTRAFENEAFFSLAAYQKGRAREISRSLDASRYHFQILFVDDDNAKARIAEGLLARVAEYNDALCVLFPASSTIVPDASVHSRAPRDAAPLEGHLQICHSLGLDPFRCEEMGTAFDLNLLDQYDLVIAMDDDIRSLILRSIPSDEPNQQYYAKKCRLLSEFLSSDFCGSIHRPKSDNPSDRSTVATNSQNNPNNGENDLLLNMLESDLRHRVEPYASVFQHRHNDDVFSNARVPSNLQQAEAVPRMVFQKETGAAVLNTQEGSWPLVEAAMILASAGLTRFCLDTIDAQLQDAFQTLLERNIYRKEHLNLKWQPDVEDQLIRCNGSVCGYFSPKQRKAQFDRHVDKLRQKWKHQQSDNSEKNGSE